MIKNSFSSAGIHTLCDRCRRIITTNFNYLVDCPDWEMIQIPRKGGNGRFMQRFDFCDEKCRIVYFRGRKYWQRKLAYIAAHDRRMDGN